jgi:hypothetical protein
MPHTVPPPPPTDDEALTIDADFDTWARVSARMLRRSVAERARAIHDAGLDATWKQIDDHWSALLSRDVGEGRIDRVDRYASICHEELASRDNSVDPTPSPLDRLVPPERRELSSQLLSETPPFARDLATEDATANPGARTKTDTDVQIDDDVRDGMLAAEEAMAWPLEKYAWLCAELAHAPDRVEHVWALHGLMTDAVRRAVETAWRRRLDNDAELEGKHDELVSRYTNVLRGEL